MVSLRVSQRLFGQIELFQNADKYLLDKDNFNLIFAISQVTRQDYLVSSSADQAPPGNCN